MTIWYILWLFGIFLHVLVFCTNKNLATLRVSATIMVIVIASENKNLELEKKST
jgi:hypothetical protein